MKQRSIIITSQLETPIRTNIDIRSDDYVICADGGFVHAFNEDIIPDVVIGDFDSSSFDELQNKLNSDKAYSNVQIIRTKPEKDDTDTFMCAKHALEAHAAYAFIIGGLSGRFDHSVANIQTLSYLLDNDIHGWILDGKNKVTLIEGPDELILTPNNSAPTTNEHNEGNLTSNEFGEDNFVANESDEVRSDYFSIYAYTPKCSGVYEIGSKYLLDNVVLTQSVPLGTSNELLDKPTTIKVREGRLLIVMS
jgi:thiamine pyrophosphokinase